MKNKQTTILKTVSILAVIAGFSACNGGGNTSNSGGNSATTPTNSASGSSPLTPTPPVDPEADVKKVCALITNLISDQRLDHFNINMVQTSYQSPSSDTYSTTNYYSNGYLSGDCTPGKIALNFSGNYSYNYSSQGSGDRKSRGFSYVLGTPASIAGYNSSSTRYNETTYGGTTSYPYDLEAAGIASNIAVSDGVVTFDYAATENSTLNGYPNPALQLNFHMSIQFQMPRTTDGGDGRLLVTAQDASGNTNYNDYYSFE